MKLTGKQKELLVQFIGGNLGCIAVLAWLIPPFETQDLILSALFFLCSCLWLLRKWRG